MTLLSTLASSTRAFTQAARRSSGPAFATARSLSGGSGGMPYPDDKMAFYALGMNLAMQVGGQSNLKTLLDDPELDIVLEAFCDTIRGTTVVDPRTVLTKYGQDLNKVLGERTDQIMDRVKRDGAEYIDGFLAANEEAVKTQSGMVYCEMKKGDGKQPTLASTVEVHYHGTLTDGTVFDSSVDRGQTISFPLGGVIKGWQEGTCAPCTDARSMCCNRFTVQILTTLLIPKGLQLMKEGGKATLVIPSDLAYGDAGSGEVCERYRWITAYEQTMCNRDSLFYNFARSFRLEQRLSLKLSYLTYLKAEQFI